MVGNAAKLKSHTAVFVKKVSRERTVKVRTDRRTSGQTERLTYRWVNVKANHLAIKLTFRPMTVGSH